MNGSSDLRPFKYYWPFKNHFSSFSGMFQMLEDATWARLAMAMSALKGFEEDNNMLKKSTLYLSTISFQTKPVPQVCESCCRNQRGQSDCSWFWRRPPHRYHDLFLKPWLRPSFFGKKKKPITFSVSWHCFRSCNRGSDSNPRGRSTKSRQRRSHSEDSLWLARLATDYRFESGLLESIKIFWVSLLSLCEHFWPYLTVCSPLP